MKHVISPKRRHSESLSRLVSSDERTTVLKNLLLAVVVCNSILIFSSFFFGHYEHYRHSVQNCPFWNCARDIDININ